MIRRWWLRCVKPAGFFHHHRRASRGVFTVIERCAFKATAVLAVSAAVAMPALRQDKPNIVFIMGDDIGM
jgi:hypothetical protein